MDTCMSKPLCESHALSEPHLEITETAQLTDILTAGNDPNDNGILAHWSFESLAVTVGPVGCKSTCNYRHPTNLNDNVIY